MAGIGHPVTTSVSHPCFEETSARGNLSGGRPLLWADMAPQSKMHYAGLPIPKNDKRQSASEGHPDGLPGGSQKKILPRKKDLTHLNVSFIIKPIQVDLNRH